MDEETRDRYEQAGRIARKIIKRARKIVKPGASYLGVVEELESMILEEGGGLACPVTVSINQDAAHDTALWDDEREISKGDLVKVDVGVHVDGYIADTATTIDLDSGHAELVQAVRRALDRALSLVQTGIPVRDIGRAIENEIRASGYKPVVNLTGHSLARYELHSGLNIPNVGSGGGVLEEGMAVAIEPFATTGSGAVSEAGTPKIFMLEKRGASRLDSERRIIDLAEKKFRGLPFAIRWVGGVHPRVALSSAIRLASRGILHAYPVLREVSGGMVAQEEHTVLVLDEPVVTTL